MAGVELVEPGAGDRDEFGVDVVGNVKVGVAGGDERELLLGRARAVVLGLQVALAKRARVTLGALEFGESGESCLLLEVAAG